MNSTLYILREETDPEVCIKRSLALLAITCSVMSITALFLLSDTILLFNTKATFAPLYFLLTYIIYLCIVLSKSPTEKLRRF